MSLHRKLNERERMAYASVARLERERDDLRAQLAEQRSLLSRCAAFTHDLLNPISLRRDIHAALSASGKLSAPTKARNECEDCGDDGQTCTACAEPERKP